MSIIPEHRYPGEPRTGECSAPSPSVRAAVIALDMLGVRTPSDAEIALEIWTQQRELTEDEHAAILAHYERVLPEHQWRPPTSSDDTGMISGPGGPLPSER